MKKNVIVTLADSNYFELLNELIQSIKRLKESENTAICVLDAGLTENQKKNLENKVIPKSKNIVAFLGIIIFLNE